MNIRWDSSEFVAEFSSDFHGDLDAVKAAGFRTNGPPEWRWYAPNVKALSKLREKRPASGLTITLDALDVYKTLAELEARNEEVKKQFAEQKKKAKKEQKKKDEEIAIQLIPEGQMWIGPEDLPPMPPFVPSYVVPPPPDLKCIYCSQPVYIEYEKVSPPMCIWCEAQLDLEQISKNN